ncbi:sialate O-acetylesterase [Clostridium sp. Marseille-P299]|uniref:sialate O-acetylesterase n=1 Tax=Clostridium sp. Marseille-P299 TaxID=1805477 RepID=UPI0009ED9FED|nr:sialate O-acetylesterase [Clostridium sp. Marseille-P299]
MKKNRILIFMLVLISSSWLGLAVHANSTFILNKKKVTMEVDSTLKLSTSNVTENDVTWSTSDPLVATVSDGTITAIAKGTATITATYQDQSYTCKVNVLDSNDDSILSLANLPTLPTNMYEVDINSTMENLLSTTKSLMTIGIDKTYIDVNDADYSDGSTPAFAAVTSSTNKDAYITKISSPEKGIIRFHFNTIITNATTVVINYTKQERPAISEKEVDLVIFMGQSNASGVGTASLAPSVKSYMGSEFRAISDPTTLYDIQEPFGRDENKEFAINDRKLKSGSLVSAFVNSYYTQTGHKLICVSASQGATSITSWQPEGSKLEDAINRFQSAKTWLEQNGYTINNKFVVWLQGETDGGLGLSSEAYTNYLNKTIDAMLENGADNFYIIRIGNNRDNPYLYQPIIDAQTELCKSKSRTVLVSTKLSIMGECGLMKDQFHYTQHGYNIVGYDAGMNVAYHILTGKEPTLYDYQTKGTYQSYTKN